MGLNPGFPRTQVMTVTGVATFAAARRGNLAYALNPCKLVVDMVNHGNCCICLHFVEG